MKKTLQVHKSDGERKRKPSPEEVTEYLENFRLMLDPRSKAPTKLISMKVELPLLDAFKHRCQMSGTPYQTKIKELMRAWLAAGGQW